MQFENALFLPQVAKFLEEGHTVTIGLKGYSMRPFLEHNRDKALLSKPTTIQKAMPYWQKSPLGCLFFTA